MLANSNSFGALFTTVRKTTLSIAVQILKNKIPFSCNVCIVHGYYYDPRLDESVSTYYFIELGLRGLPGSTNGSSNTH
jgi:hypothetical protein